MEPLAVETGVLLRILDVSRRMAEQRAFTPLNAELAKGWKRISMIKPALPDAEQWARVKDKLDQLQR